MMTNRDAARALYAVAALLESEGANVYRVRAYRRAALGLQLLPMGADAYVDGANELRLPWLGQRLRRKLGELVTQGHMQFYDDLVATLPPAKRELLTIQGVGPKTARRLMEELHLESARDVAEAAREGRLRTLRGIGKVREEQLGRAAEAILARAA